jgi:hypothetical protein
MRFRMAFPTKSSWAASTISGHTPVITGSDSSRRALRAEVQRHLNLAPICSVELV